MQADAPAKREAAGTVSVDVGKKIAIYTSPGQPEKSAPLQKGPSGFCICDFGWGPVATETPNLLFDVKPEAKAKAAIKRPAAEEKKGKKKKIPKWSHGKEAEEEKDDGKEENDGKEAEEEKDDEERAARKNLKDKCKHACVDLLSRARLLVRACLCLRLHRRRWSSLTTTSSKSIGQRRP